MSLPRFVAQKCSWTSEHEARVIDSAIPPFNGVKPADCEAVCLCADLETAELVARALNREMMQ
jgi:hypothetical protein